jgi:hypothetical protein
MNQHSYSPIPLPDYKQTSDRTSKKGKLSISGIYEEAAFCASLLQAASISSRD